MSDGNAIDRVVRDLRATTGLKVEVSRHADGAGEIVIDGAVDRFIYPPDWNPSSAAIANALQDQDVIERLGTAWPKCICHGRHPMVAVDEDGGKWVCPYDQGCSVAIGQLPAPPVDEPVVADDHVRWFRSDWGWGVIAHRDGDVWVHFSAIAGKGFRSLAEGEHVLWEAENVPQGAFTRRASRVTRESDT